MRPSLKRRHLVTVKEGFVMSYQTYAFAGQSFGLVRNAFLQDEGLPFADVLSDEEVRRAFEEWEKQRCRKR